MLIVMFFHIISLYYSPYYLIIEICFKKETIYQCLFGELILIIIYIQFLLIMVLSSNKVPALIQPLFILKLLLRALPGVRHACFSISCSIAHRSRSPKFLLPPKWDYPYTLCVVEQVLPPTDLPLMDLPCCKLTVSSGIPPDADAVLGLFISQSLVGEGSNSFFCF